MYMKGKWLLLTLLGSTLQQRLEIIDQMLAINPPAVSDSSKGAIEDLLGMAIAEVKNAQYSRSIRSVLAIFPLFLYCNNTEKEKIISLIQQINTNFSSASFDNLMQETRDRLFSPQDSLLRLQFSEVAAISIIDALEYLILNKHEGLTPSNREKLADIFYELKKHFNPNQTRKLCYVFRDQKGLKAVKKDTDSNAHENINGELKTAQFKEGHLPDINSLEQLMIKGTKERSRLQFRITASQFCKVWLDGNIISSNSLRSFQIDDHVSPGKHVIFGMVYDQMEQEYFSARLKINGKQVAKTGDDNFEVTRYRDMRVPYENENPILPIKLHRFFIAGNIMSFFNGFQINKTNASPFETRISGSSDATPGITLFRVEFTV